MDARRLRLVIVLCFFAQLGGLGLYGFKFYLTVAGPIGFRPSWVFHEVAELAAILALSFGILGSAYLLTQFRKREARLQSQLDVASERFLQVILEQFETWGFTEAEQEIGLLLIKGLSIAQIAELRSRSQATVKAQNSSIYQKSGLRNRSQLVSYFVEELTAGF